MAKSKKAIDPEKNVKVRVRGAQPIAEDGQVYHPARKEPNGAGGLKDVPADTFLTTPERAEALGDYVEVVEVLEGDAPAE